MKEGWSGVEDSDGESWCCVERLLGAGQDQGGQGLSWVLCFLCGSRRGEEKNHESMKVHERVDWCIHTNKVFR